MRGPAAAHVMSWAFSFVCASVMAQSGAKVWEHDDGVQRMVNGVSLSMQNWNSPGAPANGFTAHALNLRTGADALFRGACAELMTVEIQLRDLRKVDLSAYRASKSGRDLPVGDVLQVLRQGLAEQCEQFQAIRLTVRPVNAHQGDFDYEGTLQKSQGWKLVDGRQPTPFDSSLEFEIRLRDSLSVAGIRFRGRCEVDPVLLLEPLYANESERATTTRMPDVLNYLAVAKDASVQYAKHCAGTKRIRYAMNPLPQPYRCKQSGDCFLEATFSTEWIVDASQFPRKEINNPIVDIDDGTEVLAAGRFDILADYNDYFSYYVIAYFAGYSENCRSSIRDPVVRRYQFVKQTKDSNGYVISEEFGDPIDIYVEREHQRVFDAHWGGYQAYVLARLFKTTVLGQQRGEGVGITTMRMFDFATEGARQMRTFLTESCTAPRTLTVQDNMLRYARQQPPVTGRYATNKTLKTKSTENGSSAPAFTEKYLRDRATMERAVLDGRRQASANSRSQNAAAVPTQPEPARTTPVSAAPAAPPSSASTTTPDPGAAAHAARTLEDLSLEHQKLVQQAAQEFRAQIANARTPEERRALQQAYQAKQRAMQEAYYAKVRELRGR